MTSLQLEPSAHAPWTNTTLRASTGAAVWAATCAVLEGNKNKQNTIAAHFLPTTVTSFARHFAMCETASRRGYPGFVALTCHVAERETSKPARSSDDSDARALNEIRVLRPVVFVAAERPTLVPLGNRTGCKLGLRSQRLVAKILALALRAIAVAERRLVV